MASGARAPGARRRPVTRIATVCLLGSPARRTSANAAKLDVVQRVVSAIVREGWRELDAIVFPGGTFFLSDHIGPLTRKDRYAAIRATEFSKTAVKLCGELSASSTGLHLIAGLLSPHGPGYSTGDQVAVAWTAAGIAGMGRKVFPSPPEISDPRRHFVTYRSDYDSQDRIITLASGQPALLCACYDLFGVPEAPHYRSVRADYIRHVSDRGRVVSNRDGGFGELRAHCLQAWHEQIVDRDIRIAIGTIHGFRRPGQDVFWQRHGIASASAGLTLGAAVAAAHFEEALPFHSYCPLVAKRVPRSHLGAGVQRLTRFAQDIDHIEIMLKGSVTALMRLFQF